jgi:hypothetical protein
MSETVERQAKSKASAPKEAKVYGIVTGILVGLTENNAPVVSRNGKSALVARTTIKIGRQDIGKSVVVQFDQGDIRHPIVTGMLIDNAENEAADDVQDIVASTMIRPLPANIDDEEITFEAKRKIKFQCGASSITLEANGNVDIRGNDLTSRASGQNRIRGSSVSLN